MVYYYSDLKIETWKRKGADVVFQTAEKPKLVITVCGAASIRVWGDYKGTGEEQESVSVVETIGGFTEFTVEDKKIYCMIQTSKLTLRVYYANCHLEYFLADNETLISCDNGNKSMGWDDDGKVFLYHKLFEREHFFGLGEDNDSYLGNLDRRGTARDMMTGQRINVGHVTADHPITFFMSTGQNIPYGMFTDNTYRMTYDCGKESDDYYFWKAEGGDLKYYFFAGDTLQEVLTEYTCVTGKPGMLPLWSLGYLQCKCSYYDWDEIDNTVELLQEKKIPLDCIVFDYDWAEYFHNFKWHPRWEGKSPEKIAQYKKSGIHFMVSNAGPMIKKDSDNFKSGLEAGIFAKDQDGNTITCGHYGGELMDFSNPHMKEWIEPQLRAILEDGVESWWLDLTEPEGDSAQTQYYGGERGKIHNIFSLLNTRLYYQLTKEYNAHKRPFLLTRTGTAGIQKYNTALWSGDVFSDYESFAAHIPEALNTTMSGEPFWTSDSGGFISSTNNETDNYHLYQNDLSSHALLYERWMQFSCFCPVTRAHHAGESAPYIFNDLLTENVAYYIRLRYQLMPYIYTYTYLSHTTGIPLMRSLVLEYEKDQRVYCIKDEYLFGKELLIAPVIEEKASSRKVYLPEGIWFDWDYGYRYEGGKEYDIYAPQNRIPVFAKAGAIIPMMDLVMNTSQMDWKKINLVVYPYETSSFELYTDDGISYDYENQAYTATTISCEEKIGERTELQIECSNLLFAAVIYTFTIHVNALPCSVEHSGQALPNVKFQKNLEQAEEGYYYDILKHTLMVKIQANQKLQHQVVVRYQENSNVKHKNETNLLAAISDCGQIPFLLPPAGIPCKLPCENFDRGGEGVAYHKTESGEEKTSLEDAVYRKEGILIKASAETGSGYFVSNLNEGEWMEYTVLVRESGHYTCKVRTRSLAEAKISIDINSQNASGLISIKGKEWENAEANDIFIAKGEQVIRLFVHKGSIDVDYIDIDQ